MQTEIIANEFKEYVEKFETHLPKGTRVKRWDIDENHVEIDVVNDDNKLVLRGRFNIKDAHKSEVRFTHAGSNARWTGVEDLPRMIDLFGRRIKDINHAHAVVSYLVENSTTGVYASIGDIVSIGDNHYFDVKTTDKYIIVSDEAMKDHSFTMFLIELVARKLLARHAYHSKDNSQLSSISFLSPLIAMGYSDNNTLVDVNGKYKLKFKLKDGKMLVSFEHSIHFANIKFDFVLKSIKEVNFIESLFEDKRNIDKVLEGLVRLSGKFAFTGGLRYKGIVFKSDSFINTFTAVTDFE